MTHLLNLPHNPQSATVGQLRDFQYFLTVRKELAPSSWTPPRFKPDAEGWKLEKSFVGQQPFSAAFKQYL